MTHHAPAGAERAARRPGPAGAAAGAAAPEKPGGPGHGRAWHGAQQWLPEDADDVHAQTRAACSEAYAKRPAVDSTPRRGVAGHKSRAAEPPDGPRRATRSERSPRARQARDARSGLPGAAAGWAAGGGVGWL